jgi:predicted amidohydrolase YtcJ
MRRYFAGAGAALPVSKPLGTVEVPGFVDAHTHLLKEAAGMPFPWQETGVAEFHRDVARSGGTPMDVLDPPLSGPLADVAARLEAGLATASGAGLVEVTEMGMCAWWYLDALNVLQQRGPLSARVRIYLASGLAEKTTWSELDERRASAGPWVSLDGVKFYADGWIGPRTCALCRPFADHGGSGLLFMDADTLAHRIEPFAAHGWRIATHAIGDRAITAALDAYEMAWGGDSAALSAASPRIEHASVQSSRLTARLAESGVVCCIQPSFAVTDAEQVQLAFEPGLSASAYPWELLAESGARLLGGSDYPIEVLEPLVGLARLVSGRSERREFLTEEHAPSYSRLDIMTAFDLVSDSQAGQTWLTADPREVRPGEIDDIEVRGTAPRPFR